MRIGAARQRLTLQQPQRVDDGGGGASISWVHVVTVWGEVASKSGRETVSGGHLTGSVTHEITVRHRDDIKPTMRFLLGTRVFEIVAVLEPTDQLSWLKCLCIERDL